MPLGIQIALGQDTATPAVQRLIAGLRPAQLNPIIGRSARNTYKAYLTGLNSQRANKLGGSRTNFYLTAARGTNFTVAGDFVVVSIPSVGIAQRYFGGVIKPKAGKKFLTIPVHAAAYGHRASEFDLEIVFGKGGEPIALATKGRAATSAALTEKGKIVHEKSARLGEIYFILVRSVNQKADPSVLPYDGQVTGKALEDAAAYAQLLWDRANGGAS